MSILNSDKLNCLILAASLALACWFVSPWVAQSSQSDELNRRVVELYRAGKYAEATAFAEQELAIREKALGPDHPDVATALNNLAELYRIQGRYAEAEPLSVRSLKIREKALGPDHPDVAQALNNLAELYRVQGRYPEAEPLCQRSLKIWEKALGPDHRDVAQALNNLAILYEDQSRYAEAEPLYQRSLKIREKALGPDHPDVATALNNLALLYVDQGRYPEAEPLYRRSLQIREKALGPDHPDVAQALNNLSVLYVNQGRFAEAEPLYQRSLQILEKALGPDHPDVAAALNDLAILYEDQSRYAEAEPLYLRSLKIREKALGPDHPDVAQALNNLAMLYRDQGRFAEAEPLYQRSLQILEKALGPDYPDHPDVAAALNNLAALYVNQGRYAEAEPLVQRSLKIREKALGPDHPDVALALNNLAILYEDQGRYAEALPLVRKTISAETAATLPALPVLLGAKDSKLISSDEALDESLTVVQDAAQTSAAEALNALAARFAAGNGRLADLVRKDQDLAAEESALDKAIVEASSREPSKRNAASEQMIRDRIAAIVQARNDLKNVLANEFPDYAALSKPPPLNTKNMQALLADDEALVIVNLGAKSYVWVITKTTAEWKQLAVGADQVSKAVTTLRARLTGDVGPSTPKFDSEASYELYQQVLGPIEAAIQAKPRLSLVVNGALTSLPPQVLVTRDPAGKAFKDVDWLIRSHAITILPSIASLKVLRGKSTAAAEKPLIGFADPIFSTKSMQENARVAANVTAMRGVGRPVADTAELATALPSLPETADELRQVAASVGAAKSDVVLGPDATVTRVKETNLDNYRIVYFATHGLLAGEVKDFAKLKAEPALVLTLPERPTEFDDGLLTASDVAQLKLNADWVVLSAKVG